MRRSRRSAELHRSGRAGWLRAAVLGVDDGIVSTASLMIGVAAAGAPRSAVLIAGVAGLAAGAMAMAAGEYVSVSSQRDSERADIKLESEELATGPRRELSELTAIYVGRGLEPALARVVAKRLSAGNVLATHLREELGMGPTAQARPVQAGAVSALSFAGAGRDTACRRRICPAFGAGCSHRSGSPRLSRGTWLLQRARGWRSDRAGGSSRNARGRGSHVGDSAHRPACRRCRYMAPFRMRFSRSPISRHSGSRHRPAAAQISSTWQDTPTRYRLLLAGRDHQAEQVIERRLRSA